MSTDYYLLDELLTDEARAVRDRVRAFVEADLLPVINDYWDRADFPWPLVPKIAELGVVGGTIEGYGCPGLSPSGRRDGVAGDVARRRQHQHVLRGAVRPRHGLDQHARQRGAEAALAARDGDARQDRRVRAHRAEPRVGLRRAGDDRPPRRRRAVLNGAKRWIGNASIADVVVVWARDVDDDRVKAVVVEKDADGTHPDGYTAEVITGKIGKRAVWQPDVTLRDVRVPRDNQLAEAHSFRDATRVLTATRGGAAWESLGHAVATTRSRWSTRRRASSSAGRSRASSSCSTR